MSDRTEEEEEAYIREHARRMKISPRGLLSRLRPLGFQLSRADRTRGLNEIEYVRPSPTYAGLFDQLEVKADIDGACAGVTVVTAITPSQFSLAITDAVMQDWDDRPHQELDCRTAAAAQIAEQTIAESAAALFESLSSGAAKLHEATKGTRTAVERYFQFAAPSDDLDETYARLVDRASASQRASAERLLDTQFVQALNLERCRRLWEIAQLTQVLCWEHDESELHGLRNHLKPASEFQVEAHRRLQIFASRLAGGPGWPFPDPLAPPRADELIDPAPWRDAKLDAVGQAIDDYFDSMDMRCDCGRPWRCAAHALAADKQALSIEVVCAAAHEETIELNVKKLSAG